MTELWLTAVMKTDISGSTARYRALTVPDLSASLGEHLDLITRLAMAQNGRVIKAEVGTALVDAFAMKGFTEPIPVYRVEQRYRTQLLTEQYILFTDLHGFSQFAAGAEVAAVEKVLDRLLELVGEICGEFGGTNRFSSGDAHCLTFIEPERAM